jgi:two-component system nitrogen regulation response regulator NtrX
MQQILVVDDEIGIRELLSEILSDEGYKIMLAQNATEARASRNDVRPDMVLLDIWMPDTDGITLLKEWASSGQLTMPVVMMSGHGTIDTAVEATRIGAFDFLEKPIALQKLLATVGRALKQGAEKPKPGASLGALGRAPVIADLKQRLERIAGMRTPVVLVGEPGCGIEICARVLHARNTPWVTPETTAQLAGEPIELLNKARDGTLFVHDVAGLTRAEQKGMLLLLAKVARYNTRVVCGASRPLADIAAEGAFDAQLYELLSAMTISIPSLRQHRDDIPEVAGLILARMVEAKEIATRQFSTAALNALRNFDWPGNITQLESVVRTLAQTAQGDEITADDVARALPEPVPAQQAPAFDQPLREARDAFERAYFEYHLGKEGGNISRVAEIVGLERTHLYRKLKQLGVKLTRRDE